MPVNIRSAVFEDLPAILAMERQASTGAHWTQEQYAELVRAGVVLVAEQGGQCCGFLCAKAVAGEWEIENVVVGEPVRRRGIADALLRELLRQVQSPGGSAIWLEVRESNLPARRLYEKNGFVERGRRSGYYREPIEDAVLYQLQFEESKA
jgi:[ribosomal protein S18]-alanine N-acetyltransferase